MAEEYGRPGRGGLWLLQQVVSSVWRRRSPRTLTERGAEMFSNLRTDIRYAVRTLGRNPGFALAAIAPIALGIGINTGVFSILNSVAWRPLPAQDARALVSMHQQFQGGPRRTVHGARSLFSLPEYQAYRDDAHTLAGLIAYSRQWTVTLGRGAPQEIDGVLVSCNYFEGLGVSPVLGAGFTPANCGAHAAPAVVLSHALWTRAFGGDPQVLAQPIVLNGRLVTVVGVAPAGFDGVDMPKASFFAPLSMAAVLRPEQQVLVDSPHASWLTLIGRRRPDVDVGRVRADLAIIAHRIDLEQPGRATTLIVEPATALSLPVQRRGVLRGASVVLAAFGLVLLIAAANVANILLARAASRSREVAIRLSVGATRGRLVRQLLTESAVIALAGAVCGLLLFWQLFEAILPWLLASTGAEAMRLDATPDATVLWFALGLTVTTALAFGLVPAFHASAVDAYSAMKRDVDGGGRTRGWTRGALIGAQIALCTMLLIPAGLLSRAFQAAHSLDPGFDHDRVAMVSIELRGPRYESGAAAFHGQWLERVKALPGVQGLALASRMPLSPGRSQTTFRTEDDGEQRVVDVNTVSPEFFSLLGIPLVSGRVFTSTEADAVIVTESTARRYWPGQDAIGRVVVMDGRRRAVVGVVRDAQIAQTPEAMASYMYLPAAPGAQRHVAALVRSRADVGGLATAVRAETARLDPNLVVTVRPLADNLGLLQTLSQIAASVAGALSLLALSLAAVGVYGVVAYVVSRRMREVGVRMALGASAHDVRRLILGQTLRPVAIGLCVGVAGAAAMARLLQSVLFGVSPYDPLAFAGAPLVMLAIAVAAALAPTRRAIRVNPMAVLRSE